jgi:hypothetical protein
LQLTNYDDGQKEYAYTINGSLRSYLVEAKYQINHRKVERTSPVVPLDEIEIERPVVPRLYQVLGLTTDCSEYMKNVLKMKHLTAASFIVQPRKRNP